VGGKKIESRGQGAHTDAFKLELITVSFGPRAGNELWLVGSFNLAVESNSDVEIAATLLRLNFLFSCGQPQKRKEKHRRKSVGWG